jgi:hypothetical protein
MQTCEEGLEDFIEEGCRSSNLTKFKQKMEADKIIAMDDKTAALEAAKSLITKLKNG